MALAGMVARVDKSLRPILPPMLAMQRITADVSYAVQVHTLWYEVIVFGCDEDRLYAIAYAEYRRQSSMRLTVDRRVGRESSTEFIRRMIRKVTATGSLVTVYLHEPTNTDTDANG
jgi:hypothetical protein